MSEINTVKETNESTTVESLAVNRETLEETHETEFPERTSQEVAENSFHTTIEHVNEDFGETIPESQKVRIDICSENAVPEVMSYEEYHSRFNETDLLVLGHCDAEGHIYIKEGDEDVINHVAAHESLHFASFNEIYDCDPENTRFRMGISEITIDKNGETENKNVALNEGITELYTLRELKRRGEENSIEAVNAYSESTVKAYELSQLVGEEKVEKAYFGGDLRALEDEVIRLNNGDRTAWKRYSENVDILEYSDNPSEVKKARTELSLQNAVMRSYKNFYN